MNNNAKEFLNAIIEGLDTFLRDRDLPSQERIKLTKLRETVKDILLPKQSKVIPLRKAKPNASQTS